jgi:hypothetical protein
MILCSAVHHSTILCLHRFLEFEFTSIHHADPVTEIVRICASHDASIDVDTEDMETNGMIDASGNIPGFRNGFLNEVAVGRVKL